MANCPEDGDIMEGFGARDDTSIMRVGALCLEVIGELERLNATDTGGIAEYVCLFNA